MAASAGPIKRLEISYQDGINSAVASNIAKKTELAHAENVRSVSIGTYERRGGETAIGNDITPVANYGVFNFAIPPATGRGLYRITKVGGTTSIYYLNASNVWTALSGGGTSLTVGFAPSMGFNITVGDTLTISEYVVPEDHNFNINVSDRVIISEAYTDHSFSTDLIDAFDYTIAEGNLFLVNQSNVSKYISSNGTTVVDSSSSTGHLFNCPRANVINYYKGRLYVADFTYSTVRYKTSVLRSSLPVGIVSLVSADLSSSIATSIQITDNKYIYAGSESTTPGTGISVNDQRVISESVSISVGGATVAVTESVSLAHNALEVYRGNKKVATIVVSSVEEDTISLAQSPKYEQGFSTILASDELWVSGTFFGAKQFRWVSNPSAGGVNVKDYDTFRTGGQDNEEVKMMVNVGNIMLIGSNNSLSAWNDSVLQNLNVDFGCVSRKGYIKNAGSLFFIHYSGLYKTTGAATPERISDKVQRYFDGATKSGLENSVLFKKGKSIFCTLGTVTLYNPDGSVDKTLNNTCAEYNFIQDNFYVHTGVSATDATTWVEETNVDRCVLAGGTLDTAILEFLSGLTDNTREIPMRADTPNLMLGATFEKISKPIEVIIESERGSGLKCFISLDYGQWYEIEGETVKGCTILKITGKDGHRGSPPRCRNIRVSLRDNSKRICKVNKVAVNYLISDEEEEMKADYEQR